jgi:hypothetical protein
VTAPYLSQRKPSNVTAINATHVHLQMVRRKSRMVNLRFKTAALPSLSVHKVRHTQYAEDEIIWFSAVAVGTCRFYSLTRAGRKQVEAEVATWERLSAGVNLVLQPT